VPAVAYSTLACWQWVFASALSGGALSAVAGSAVQRSSAELPSSAARRKREREVGARAPPAFLRLELEGEGEGATPRAVRFIGSVFDELGDKDLLAATAARAAALTASWCPPGDSWRGMRC
jgi:ADP-ribose pyrophosphatase YjhB (NUDIX family)